MDERPRVSVLLPCRDAAATLPACIESLGAQTFRDFEVVAVDDGSRDGTRRRLEGWAASDARVRVLGTPPRGLVPALRRAAAAARGDLLARMDADDVADPDRLAAQVRLLDGEGKLAACGTGVRFFPREGLGSGTLRYEAWLNGLRTPEEVARDLLVECPVAHPTLMIRREALARAGGYLDPGWPEDWDLVLRLHLTGGRCANVDGPLHRWRVHPDRLSRRSDRYSPGAFRRCRVHYLLAGFVPREREPVIWGAGSVGKGLARELRRQGGRHRAFVDLDPRKLGQRIHGAPVLSPGELAAGGAGKRPYVLVAVGSPGARDEVRGWLAREGWTELEDFRAVA